MQISNLAQAKDIILLTRPLQWLKNLFIFLPLFFSLRIFEEELLLKTIVAASFFCLLSSSIYIYNDYHDIEEDKKHPMKRNRPLASGRVKPRIAITTMIILLTISLLGLWLMDAKAFLLSIFYLSINFMYTLKLKHVPIVDVLIVAIGYVVRIFLGGFVGNIKIYPWIVTMTFLLAIFVALGKRRDDLLIYLESGNKPRKAIEGYNLRFVDSAMMIMAAVVLVAYVMYTLSPDIMTKFKTDKLYFTSFFVIIGLLRYLQITMVHEKSGSPTEILIKDTFLQIAIVGWLISFFILIYMV